MAFSYTAFSVLELIPFATFFSFPKLNLKAHPVCLVKIYVLTGLRTPAPVL